MNNAENTKRIAKNTAMLYIRMIVTMLITLYTGRVILDKLGAIDYGIFNTVGGIVIMFSFLNSSLSSATQRFLTFYIGKGNEDDLRRVFSTCVFIHIALALLILIVSETIGMWFLDTHLNIPDERMLAARYVLHFTTLASVMMLISTPYNALIIAHEKMNVFAYISFIEVGLKLTIVYLITLFEFDRLVFYSFLWLVINILLRIVYGMYSKRKFSESTLIKNYDKKMIRDISTFASWSLTSSMSWAIQNQGVNFMLNIFFGPAINAARGIAFQVQGAVKAFASNFQVAINPQIIKSYAQEEYEYMHKLIYSSSKLSCFLLLVLSAPVIAETPFILSLWLVDVPDFTIQFVRLTLVISIIDSIYSAYSVGVQATGQQKLWTVTVSIFGLCILPVSYVLFKVGFNPTAVFVVNIITTFIGQTFAVAKSKNLLRITLGDFMQKTMIPICVVSLLSILLLILIKSCMNNGVVSSVMMIPLSFAVSSALVYTLGLNRREKSVVRQQVSTIISKLRIYHG